MKNTTIYIALFVVWCVICGTWYVFGIKDLTIDPSTVNPAVNLGAIVEIMVMVLVAFLIGYLVAYSSREEFLQSLYKSYYELNAVYQGQQTKQIQLRESMKQLRQEKVQLGKEHEEKHKTLQQELDWLQQQLDEGSAREAQLLGELTTLRSRAEQLEGQLTHMRFKVNQLEYEQKERPPVQVKILPPNDLKKIRGIGPAIEKKLNALGIYTYKQISELDDAALNKVSEAIKYFPDRILWDDWVGQARRLL